MPEIHERRILFALYYYTPYTSGLTLYVKLLAEHLALRGAHVSVIAGRHEPQLRAKETINGVHVVRVRPAARIDKGMVLPWFLPTVLRWARTVDVVIPVMPLMEAGVLSRLIPRGKLLPMYICDLRLGSGWLPRIVQRLSESSARAAVRRSRRVVALSEDYVRSSRVISRYADRAVEVPPPVDPAAFRWRSPDALRERLRIGDGPVVGFVGRLVREKGLPHLIRAMRTVRGLVPDARLVVVGEGRDIAGGGILDELRSITGGDEGVVFTGYLSDEDLLSFYSMCTVLALPSVDPLEAFGMVQVEAMLCGCPVVASDMPGVRIPVERTDMGILVPPGDEHRLAEALISVIQDRGAFERDRSTVVESLDPGPSYERLVDLVCDMSAE